MFQLQVKISWHVASYYEAEQSTYKCHQWHLTRYMVFTPSFDVCTRL